MDRYFIVSNLESTSEYGWIYTMKEEHKDFYVLEGSRSYEIVYLPKSDVFEIFEEEYNLITTYMDEGRDTTGIIDEVFKRMASIQKV